MKRGDVLLRIKHILAAVTLLALLVGCAESGAKSQKELWGCSLKITLSSWSGWVEDYEPQEVTYECEINGLGEIVVPLEGRFGFDITEINAKGITFKTTEPLALFDGTIDLNTQQRVFTVYKGHTLSLVTPTTDCGNEYIIELVDLFRID